MKGPFRTKSVQKGPFMIFLYHGNHLPFRSRHRPRNLFVDEHSWKCYSAERIIMLRSATRSRKGFPAEERNCPQATTTPRDTCAPPLISTPPTTRGYSRNSSSNPPGRSRPRR